LDLVREDKKTKKANLTPGEKETKKNKLGNRRNGKKIGHGNCWYLSGFTKIQRI